MGKFKDYMGNELEKGDRVIVGKSKDICLGTITSDIPDNKSHSSFDWTWIDIKCEDSNTTIARRTNQVIKY